MAHRQPSSAVNPAILKQERRENWITILTSALATVIAIAGVLYPELVAPYLKFAKVVVVGIWYMLCDFASVCREFIRSVLG